VLLFFNRGTGCKITAWIFLVILLFLGMGMSAAFAQEILPASKEKIKEQEQGKETASLLPKNPKKATLLSAVLPGAGQVYNGKTWKVPLLYAGILTDVYFIQYNNRRYESFRDALFALDAGEKNQFPSLNRAALVRNVDYWRQNRDMTLLLLLGIYALNLVDANVDAHLSGFDVSDDISLKVAPQVGTFSSSSLSYGFSLKLNIH
jgi:hypothetical protein